MNNNFGTLLGKEQEKTSPQQFETSDKFNSRVIEIPVQHVKGPIAQSHRVSPGGVVNVPNLENSTVFNLQHQPGFYSDIHDHFNNSGFPSRSIFERFESPFGISLIFSQMQIYNHLLFKNF
jgi:hypothetical protein